MRPQVFIGKDLKSYNHAKTFMLFYFTLLFYFLDVRHCFYITPGDRLRTDVDSRCIYVVCIVINIVSHTKTLAGSVPLIALSSCVKRPTLVLLCCTRT